MYGFVLLNFTQKEASFVVKASVAPYIAHRLTTPKRCGIQFIFAPRHPSEPHLVKALSSLGN